MKKKNLFSSKDILNGIRDSFKKLNPADQIRNPVMFIVYLGAIVTSFIVVSDIVKNEFSGFNFQIALWLWGTVLFANFAEAIAEGKGKAQAASLKNTKKEAVAIYGMGKINPLFLQAILKKAILLSVLLEILFLRMER